MRRYEVKTAANTVAYGKSEGGGVFLEVMDRRLAWKEGDKVKVQMVTSLIGNGDGRGCYFSAHTGTYDNGFRVSEDTMRTFLRRFNVPEIHIAQLGL